MKRRTLALGFCVALTGLATAAGCSLASRDDPAAVADPARPSGNPLNNAYFGDLHVHTKISTDAFLRNNMLSAEEAYRFAKGGPVRIASGETARLSRPLDFVAITDHAESFGAFDLCTEGTGPEAQHPLCRDIKRGDGTLEVLFRPGVGGIGACPGTPEACRAAADRTWAHIRGLAERENQPGRFTAFAAYEYSATTDGGKRADSGHLHRNVIFAGSAAPGHAESAVDAPRNVELWKWLEAACTSPCDVLAIPHNTNVSWGLAFALETPDRQPYSQDDWARRARFERLVEIFQIKGGSECGVGFGATDEECGYQTLAYPPCRPGETERCTAEGSWVRNALKRGLGLRTRLGFNPFKLGFVASTDTHSSVPGAVAENDWPGTFGTELDRPGRRLDNAQTLRRNPGGLAGIWAPENTRPALFAAMKRRETFGTSGPRIRVRFFGGWEFAPDSHRRVDWVAHGYRRGAPMGGDLAHAARGRAPVFVAWAARDAHGAPLSRMQVVKGWVEDDVTREAIYDIACSDGLVPDARTRRCPDNGAKVSLADCRASADRGATELSTTWRDPDFDPRRPAFYYLRVFENPTCRWSTFDAIRHGRPIPPFPAPVQQERAWSSPIWYEPPGG